MNVPLPRLLLRRPFYFESTWKTNNEFVFQLLLTVRFLIRILSKRKRKNEKRLTFDRQDIWATRTFHRQDRTFHRDMTKFLFEKNAYRWWIIRWSYKRIHQPFVRHWEWFTPYEHRGPTKLVYNIWYCHMQITARGNSKLETERLNTLCGKTHES